MSEQNINQKKFPEEFSDVLLVLDKEKNKIQAVKGIDKNGELETLDVKEENQNQFIHVDKHGDLFSNFFSNFLSQLKTPTNFTFFTQLDFLAVETAKQLQKVVELAPSKMRDMLLKKYEVKLNNKQEHNKENQNNMETTQTKPETGEYRFKPEQIDWDTMNNLGLGKERLEKMRLLEPLLKGYKTNELVPISLNFGTAILRTDARISLQSIDGLVVPALHGIRKEPNLNFEFFGHKFTDEDKKNLLETGNMGRVVNLTNSKTGELMPSIISVDRLTNELIALRTDFIKIPDEIKGVKLDVAQKQTLMEGKPLQLDGMISKKGTEFSATVQFNADKRYVEFLFDRSNSNQQSQSNRQNNQQSQTKEVPKTFRGKELTDEQYKDFKNGQTIYVDGLKDKKGQPYQGYITYNKETGITDFAFPSQVKGKTQPTEAHKTQTAVNSEGKMNEATKNIKEPLKSGQKTPIDKKQMQQQDKPKAQAKSKSRKM